MDVEVDGDGEEWITHVDDEDVQAELLDTSLDAQVGELCPA